jgi:hypothetical protein
MLRMSWFISVLLCGSFVSFSPVLRAEAPAVTEHYELGKAALDAGKPADALGHFKTALTQADSSLGSTWQMLLAVALTYQALEQPANSAQMFRRFLEVTEAHGELMTEKWRKRREVVRKQLTLLEQELSESHAVVMITSTPPSAAISVDGARAGVDGDAVTPTRLWLAPGEHTIELALKGFESTTRTMTTRAGGLDSYAPTLTSLTVAAPVASSPTASVATTLESEETAGAAAIGGVLWWLLDGDDAQETDAAFGLIPTTQGVHVHASWRF